MIQTTLNFLIRDGEVLLAMKKRGFGKDKWNGTGGKLHEGETPEMAIVRETEEEIGVKVEVSAMEKVAVIDFHFVEKPDWDQQCHVYMTKSWGGEPAETEEMRPQWFPFDAIPYDAMWVDDAYWLPLVLAGKKVKAEFHFEEGGKKMVKHSVEESA